MVKSILTIIPKAYIESFWSEDPDGADVAHWTLSKAPREQVEYVYFQQEGQIVAQAKVSDILSTELQAKMFNCDYQLLDGKPATCPAVVWQVSDFIDLRQYNIFIDKKVFRGWRYLDKHDCDDIKSIITGIPTKERLPESEQLKNIISKFFK